MGGKLRRLGTFEMLFFFLFIAYDEKTVPCLFSVIGKKVLVPMMPKFSGPIMGSFDYCSIFFFMSCLLYHNVAVFNKDFLNKNLFSCVKVSPRLQKTCSTTWWPKQ